MGLSCSGFCWVFEKYFIVSDENEFSEMYNVHYIKLFPLKYIHCKLFFPLEQG